MYTKFLLLNLLMSLTSVAALAQTQNTSIQGSFTDKRGNGKLYVFVNNLKADSATISSGSFAWKGHLHDISLTEFRTEDNKVASPKILIGPGDYTVHFDTVTRFLKNAMTGEKHFYTAYRLRPDDKLRAEAEYQRLYHQLEKEDSNELVSLDSIYARKKYLVLQFLNKYPSRYAIGLISNLGSGIPKLFTADELTRYFNLADTVYQHSVFGTHHLDFIKTRHLSAYGKPLADLFAITPAGDTLSITELKGKYVFIDFWASWCVPCRGENPHLRTIYNTYRSKGFEIVSFSLDDNPDKWKDAIAKDAMNWLHISDLKGWKYDDGIAYQFGITAIPDNILIDPKGIVIDKGLHGLLLEKRLKELFH